MDAISLAASLILYGFIIGDLMNAYKHNFGGFFQPNIQADAELRILFNFGSICFPLLVALTFKVYAGINMFMNKFSKGTFSTYFMISWTFYCSTAC